MMRVFRNETSVETFDSSQLNAHNKTAYGKRPGVKPLSYVGIRNRLGVTGRREIMYRANFSELLGVDFAHFNIDSAWEITNYALAKTGKIEPNSYLGVLLYLDPRNLDEAEIIGGGDGIEDELPDYATHFLFVFKQPEPYEDGVFIEPEEQDFDQVLELKMIISETMDKPDKGKFSLDTAIKQKTDQLWELSEAIQAELSCNYLFMRAP